MQYTTSSSEFTSNAAKNSPNCVLCFAEFNGNNDYKTNLLELCCKYLHSGLIKDISPNICHTSFAFCPKCSESAMELMGLSEQLQSIQKSVSELVVMFTLDILHRRGKYTNGLDENPQKKLIEFDVSALPSGDFCNEPISVPIASVSVERSCQKTENLGDDQISDPLFIQQGIIGFENPCDFTIEQIKCENDHNNWIDERNPDEEENYTTFQTAENELTFSGIGNQDCIEETGVHTDRRNNSHQRKLKTGRNRGRPKGSYKIIRNNPASFQACDLQISSQQISNSTEFPSTSTSIQSSSLSSSIVDPSSFESYTLGNEIKCDVCGKEFKNKHYLWKHKLIHTEERKHSCDFCHRRFREKSSLTMHRKLHTGDRPFQCSDCPKSFTHPQGLLYHTRTQHTKEKPFKCPTCNKRFGSSGHLNQHIATHTGVKPFQCDQCNYSCNRKGNLKSHKMNIHSKLKL